MALDFPASPITGQTYTGPGGIIWAWDGVKWVNGTQIGTAYAPIASPLFTGDPRSTTTPPPGDADTSLATTAFVAAAVAPAGNNAGRNLIHNPCFAVWQRGSGGWSGNNAFTADRWQQSFTGTAATTAQNVLTDAVRASIGDEAAVYALRTTFTGTATAADYTIMMHRIEGVRRLGGKTVTVSFWAMGEQSGLRLGASISQVFGTGGSPSTTVDVNGQSVALASANAWTRYSITLALPSTAGKTLGTNGDDFNQFTVWYTSGTNHAAQSGNVGVQSGTINLWGVQLEIGSVATPLDYGGSPQQQLAQCQRFYYVLDRTIDLSGYATSGGQSGYSPLAFPVTMRASPTTSNYTSSASNVSASGPLQVRAGGLEFYATAGAAGLFSLSVNPGLQCSAEL